MAKYAGNDLVLKVEDTPSAGTFTLVGGASSHTYSLTNSNIDTTDKDSSRWGETQPFGRRQITFNFNGFVSDNAQFAQLVAVTKTDSDNLRYQIDYGNSETVEADFHIDSLEITGESEGAQQFTISMTSSGTPTFS